jgi:hypothetical protein
MHQLRIASKSDQSAILLFLKQNWKEDHIYIQNEALFEYDFLSGDRLNFILAINTNDELDGILGFIQYSPEGADSDLSTALWKVKPKSGDPSLGIKLLNSLIYDFKFRVVSTVGANPRTLPIYEFLGYFTGQLKHYFMLNDRRNTFNIIKNAHGVIGIYNELQPVSDIKLVRYETFEELSLDFDVEAYKQYSSFKSSWYINKRYFCHPIYTYNVFGIQHNNHVNSILITREIIFAKSKILRVIDFLGDDTALCLIGGILKNIIHENDYEYIDFYQYGIADEIMKKAGFLFKNDFAELIIPNYFEPFEQSNVDINFFTCNKSSFRAFKGDGDQDRPNILQVS